MNQTIWYCAEDNFIFPDEKAAREGYKKWCQNNGEYFDEEIFHDCYKEITFEEFNKLNED